MLPQKLIDKKTNPSFDLTLTMWPSFLINQKMKIFFKKLNQCIKTLKNVMLCQQLQGQFEGLPKKECIKCKSRKS